MLDKFERKYKKILADRNALAESKKTLINKVNPMITHVTDHGYHDVVKWNMIMDDLNYISNQIIKHSIVHTDLLKQVIKSCHPNTISLFDLDNDLNDVETFIVKLDANKTKYTDLLAPVNEDKTISNILKEIEWIGIRETLCKIKMNSISGNDLKGSISFNDGILSKLWRK